MTFQGPLDKVDHHLGILSQNQLNWFIRFFYLDTSHPTCITKTSSISIVKGSISEPVNLYF